MRNKKRIKFIFFDLDIPKNWKKFDTNSEPLLEMTWEETSYLENTWRTNRHAKSADMMMLWAEIKIACLVGYIDYN